MKRLIISFQNELRKLRGTFASWLTIIGALFVPAIYLVFYLVKSTEPISAEGINPWDKFFGLHLMAAGPLLLPLFIVLLTSLIVQIEHKADGIKKIYTLPVPKWCLYLSKVLVVLLMITLTYGIFLLSIIGSGMLLGELRPHLGLHLYDPDYLLFLKALSRSLLAVLGVLGIQFWLSFKIRNFIVPLGVGMVFIVTALTIHRAEEAIYFPYTYNLLNLFDADPGNMKLFTRASVYSLIVFAVTLVGGYFHTSRTNIQ